MRYKQYNSGNPRVNSTLCLTNELQNMNKVKVTLRNYRNIPYNNPISFEINDGITFILGVNNIGKSNLLKIFRDLRPVFSKKHSLVDKNSLIASISDYLNTGTGISYGQLLNQESTKINIDISIDVVGEKTEYKLIMHPHNGKIDYLSYNGFHFSFFKNETRQGYFNPNVLGIMKNVVCNSLYIGSFRTPNAKSSGDYFDIKIGTDFISTWDDWANGSDITKRNKIIALRDELKELFGFKRFEISVHSNKSNLIINTETGSFLLDELGGGISHFILVLGNALIKEPDFILIDEPENALHPKLQQTFIRTLASKAKYGLIATSHSIGLARSTADHIYSLTKNPSSNKLSLKKFGEHYTPSIMNSINELGYSQFVELGGNNILLVEGRTDIKSFKEILRKYNIEHHFIVMDLGGSNMITKDSYEELKELKRLNAKSYSVIVDSEISGKEAKINPKISEFKDMCESLNFNVFLTEVHSTDNYITQEAINTILSPKYPKLDPYENLESKERKSNGTKWSKKFNWKMFREMRKEDFKDTKLEQFILEILTPFTK